MRSFCIDRGRRGQSLVELSLCAMPLLFLIALIVQVGEMMVVRQKSLMATRYAAFYAVRAQKDMGDFVFDHLHGLPPKNKPEEEQTGIREEQESFHRNLGGFFEELHPQSATIKISAEMLERADYNVQDSATDQPLISAIAVGLNPALGIMAGFLNNVVKDLRIAFLNALYSGTKPILAEAVVQVRLQPFIASFLTESKNESGITCVAIANQDAKPTGKPKLECAIELRTRTRMTSNQVSAENLAGNVIGGLVKAIVTTVTDSLPGVGSVIGPILDAFGLAFEAVAQFVGAVVKGVAGALGAVWNFLTGQAAPATPQFQDACLELTDKAITDGSGHEIHVKSMTPSEDKCR